MSGSTVLSLALSEMNTRTRPTQQCPMLDHRYQCAYHSLEGKSQSPYYTFPNNRQWPMPILSQTLGSNFTHSSFV
ncbi:hypothetical protein HOO68_06145 [Candidatus Gracilibacteria bacterium]|nr:hypothetical protein [Candidatus Gracilibacteria bacterium]